MSGLRGGGWLHGWLRARPLGWPCCATSLSAGTGEEDDAPPGLGRWGDAGGVRLRWRSAEEAEEAEEEAVLLRSVRSASMAARIFLSHCACCAAVSPRHASVAQRLGHS